MNNDGERVNRDTFKRQLNIRIDTLRNIEKDIKELGVYIGDERHHKYKYEVNKGTYHGTIILDVKHCIKFIKRRLLSQIRDMDEVEKVEKRNDQYSITLNDGYYFDNGDSQAIVNDMIELNKLVDTIKDNELSFIDEVKQIINLDEHIQYENENDLRLKLINEIDSFKNWKKNGYANSREISFLTVRQYRKLKYLIFEKR